MMTLEKLKKKADWWELTEEQWICLKQWHSDVNGVQRTLSAIMAMMANHNAQLRELPLTYCN